MKLRCMICKKERELTAEEIKEIGEWIDRKNLQAVDYLTRFMLEDGYTCKNGREHKYEFSEEFDKEVHELAADIAAKVAERDELIKRLVEIEQAMRKLIDESKDKNGIKDGLEAFCEELGGKLRDMTGNDSYELWI